MSRTKYSFRTQQTREAFLRFRRRLALDFSWWRINKLGIMQRELVEKAKVARTTVSQIETGRRCVTLESLVVIADAFGYDVHINFIRRTDGAQQNGSSAG